MELITRKINGVFGVPGAEGLTSSRSILDIRVPGVADSLRRLQWLGENGWSRTLDQSLQGGS